MGGAIRLERGEETPEEHLPIRLHRHAVDGALAFGSKLVSSVPSALSRAMLLRVVGDAEPLGRRGEVAANDDLAVRLHCHTPDNVVRIGIKAGVQRPVGIDPRDAIASRG